MKRTKSIASVSLMIAFMAITGLTVNAQSWSTSKAVNKVANPTVFNSEELKSTHLEVNSNAQPSPAISKGVSRVSMKSPAGYQEQGNVASKGTPAWAQSKQVTLIGERSSDSDSNPVKGTEPMIPTDKKESIRE
jgi:hypothetical protein